MELSVIIPHIEALIFAAERPLTTLELCDLVNNALGFIEDRATLDQTEAAVEAIKEKYAAEFYPFEVRESGGGLQFLTKKEFHKTVAQINGDKFLKRLSTAALETLSIIAYKQPITKGEMEAIRGVNCDYAVQKLLEKELIVILGRNEKMPGHPLIYSTSRSFMDYFGINSADDLPKIKEIISTELTEPTGVQSDSLQVPGDDEQELSTEALVVTEDGSLIETTDVIDALDEIADDSDVLDDNDETPDQSDALDDNDETPDDGDALDDNDEIADETNDDNDVVDDNDETPDETNDDNDVVDDKDDEKEKND